MVSSDHIDNVVSRPTEEDTSVPGSLRLDQIKPPGEPLGDAHSGRLPPSSWHGDCGGCPVVRDPHDLRIHPALLDTGYSDRIDDLNEAERERNCIPKPLLISTNGTILAGFGRWRSALLHQEHEIECVEFALSEEDSLQFVLVHHKPRRGWNAFVRVHLALKLEPYFQRRALANMRDGGRYKGSAKLPTLHYMDVRKEIAHIAGVGTRNVSNVKLILKDAHPRLVLALCEGSLTINKARNLCKLPKPAQLTAFNKGLEDREVDAVIRQALKQKSPHDAIPNAGLLLTALLEQESCCPGSVVINRTRSGNLALSVRREVLQRIKLQRELVV